MEQEFKDLARVEASEAKDSKKRWQSPKLMESDYSLTNNNPGQDEDFVGEGSLS